MNPEFSFGPPSGEDERLDNVSPIEKTASPERSEEIERAANSRQGDQFKERGNIEKAIDYYQKAQDEQKLAAIRKEILESGDIRKAQYLAEKTGESLSNKDLEEVADHSFKSRDRIEDGYEALEEAGYIVGYAKNPEVLNDYKAFWKEGIDLDRHSRRMLDLGRIHARQKDYYEAISRFESVLLYAGKSENEALVNLAKRELVDLGRKCIKAGSLYNAFSSFKAAGALEELKELSQKALSANPQMENLALWINMEIVELESQETRA